VGGTDAKKAAEIALLKRDLTEFYRKYNKNKIPHVHLLVTHFKGDRAKLNKALQDAYKQDLDTMDRERREKQQRRQLPPQKVRTAPNTGTPKAASMSMAARHKSEPTHHLSKPPRDLSNPMSLPKWVQPPSDKTAVTPLPTNQLGKLKLGAKLTVRKPASSTAGGPVTAPPAHKRWANSEVVKITPHFTTVKITDSGTHLGRHVCIPTKDGRLGEHLMELSALYVVLLCL